MIRIRKETSADIEAIRKVNALAFGQPTEGEIVDRLREKCPDFLSLVADLEGKVVGHVLFTPAVIESEYRRLVGTGLAPMAVLPDHQHRAIGAQLVTAGLEAVKRLGHPFVIVLGHPAYYPRFGFVPASRFGIKSEYEMVPDEAFMIRVFDETALKGVAGVARLRPEFSDAM